MRVALVSRPQAIGAYQRKAELLAAEPGIELVVLAPERWRGGGADQRLERVHTEGYRLIGLPLRWPGSFHWHVFRGLRPALARIQPDLVHVDEEPYNRATIHALRAARAAGAPGLFFSWQNLHRRYPPPFRGWERRVHRAAAGAIAGSAEAAEVLRAKGYAGPLWTIPQFGVDEAQFRPPAAPRPATAGCLRVGYAGRLVPEKGLDTALEALAALGEGVTLALVGAGPERAALEARASALGLGGRVTFLGALPSTRMPDFYQGIDALVLPSRTTRSWKEQFGRVLVEAMACEAVCVGSDSGEIPRVIGAAGRVVPEGDAAALAAALDGLAGAPEARAALGRAARARVLERYTMRRVAADTAAAWRAILADA